MSYVQAPMPLETLKAKLGSIPTEPLDPRGCIA